MDIAGTNSAFPLTGQIWEINYGDRVMQHDYRVPGRISFPLPDGTATTDLFVTQVDDNVFALCFRDQESTIIAIANLVAYTMKSFIVLPEGRTMHYAGNLTRIPS
ncbi:hypothetical protein [Amycolatopsis sp. NPDC049868]|uniref:hypothetical protein n=1 Tax=Amycolatopsis sp. NPDC049868 TaxID=3363934 RepID=UPI00378E4AC1